MEHYCEIHKTKFFKSKNMRRYAHPILVDGEATGKWCNEPEGQPKEKEKPFTYSPEKSASIETQVAVKATVDCWVAGKFKDTDDAVVRLREWILAHLDGVNPTTTAVKGEPKMPLLTDEEVKQVLKAGGMAIPEEAKAVVYANKTQLEQLTALHKQYPGEIEKLKVKYGFQEKKLTKAQAGKLIAELIVVKVVTIGNRLRKLS